MAYESAIRGHREALAPRPVFARVALRRKPHRATFWRMDSAERDALESELRRMYDSGDLHAVATHAIRSYGPEIFGFLVGMARDADVASEIFAGTCERIWRGLPGFRWESSLRVWAYAITRHHFHRWLRDRAKQRRNVPLSDTSQGPELAAVIRSTTAEYLRTDVKDGFARLRESLDPDDQLLLALRIDGKLKWNDVARVMADEDRGEPSARDVAALRKRFERLKQRIRELARAQKLLP
jgi:RNA polymerase sigma-70 factor (ECF subfamily)